MARRGFAKTIGVVLAAVVAIGFLGYALMSPAIGRPSESRRVTHPDGFSVVIPPDWERHVTPGDGLARPATLQALPSKPVGNPGTFTVTRMSEVPTPAGLAERKYAATTFQGMPAFEKWRVDKVDREHSRSVLFERDGVWYDVLIRRSLTEPLDRGPWLQYAETFRVEPMRTMPTIRLATAPAAPASRPTTAAAP